MSQSHDQTQHGSGPAGPQAGRVDPLAIRVMAVSAVAQYHSVHLDPDTLHLAPGVAPTGQQLLAWARAGGLRGKSVRLNWRRLMKRPNAKETRLPELATIRGQWEWTSRSPLLMLRTPVAVAMGLVGVPGPKLTGH